MHSHIAILDSKNRPLTLQPDTSINITDKNPMFNDVEMFSQPIPLPFEQNRHLLGNMDDVNSSTRANDIRGERFRILVDGLPLRNTAIKVQDGTLLNDTIDVNFDATNRTFKDMISDMRCRDVTVDDDILIGEKIGDVGVDIDYVPIYDIGMFVTYHPENISTGEIGPEVKSPLLFDSVHLKRKSINATFQPPASCSSYPAICETTDGIRAAIKEQKTVSEHSVNVPVVKDSFVNVSLPYPAAKYCNSRVCYAHHAEENGETSDKICKSGSANPSNGYDFSPYWVLPAQRPASGVCFYVGYFLECLFKTLGVDYDMDALTQNEDFTYMCFFTTACHFRTENTDTRLESLDDINDWLSTRGCGGKISIDITPPANGKVYNDYDASKLDYVAPPLVLTRDEYDHWDNGLTIENYGTVGHDITEKDGSIIIDSYSRSYVGSNNEPIESDRMWIRAEVLSKSATAYVQRMYATSDNFPDVNVTEIIESLENSFGVRFCYDSDTNKVTVRLLRDMFRDDSEPVKFQGNVKSMVKKANDLTGVRMKYSAEDDATEQKDNIRYNKRDYDTTYNYIDYREGRTEIKSYVDAKKLIDLSNMTCYVDSATGDAFRIKVSSEAKSAQELRPSMFEVGGLKGVELGDCSVQAEKDDTVKEFVSQFEPIITNNLKNADDDIIQVPFIDEDMEHEFITCIIQNSFAVEWGEAFVNYEISSTESYDPTSSDDGMSPLHTHNWGLTVGILRPAVNNGEATFEYDKDYDGFGNSRWGLQSSEYAVTSDSFDVFGRFLGTNRRDSFSLKPRAYKPFLYYTDDGGATHVTTDLTLLGKDVDGVEGKTWLVPCKDDIRDADGTINTRIMSRGMCDTWMAEYFRFLLYRQCYEVKALCTAAEILDIQNKWLRKFEIDGKIGWINTVESEMTAEKGIGEVKIEFFAV